MSRNVCTPLGGEGFAPPERPVVERLRGDPEVVGGFSEAEARQAAGRCLAAHTCTYCEVCELLCPDQCITRDAGTGEIQIDLNHCKGCGLCAVFCPKGAIQMEPERAD